MLSRATASLARRAATHIPARALSGSVEWSPAGSKVEYEGPDSKNPLAFKHYNPEEVIHGRVRSIAGRDGAAWSARVLSPRL